VKSIKTLGIAVLAALALTAVAGAGSASAALFSSEVGNTKWSGTRAEQMQGEYNLSLNGEVWTCHEANFSSSTVAGKTSTELTTAQGLAFTFSPGCVFIGQAVFWNMDGCQYRFHAGAATSSVGTMDIVGCKAGLVFSRPSPACRVEIPNQTGLGPVEYKSVGSGSTRAVTIKANITNITFKREGAGCVNVGTYSNGHYTGEWTVTGSASSKQVPVWYEFTTPVKFATEKAPANIVGEEGTNNKVFLFPKAGAVWCNKYSLSGTTSTVTTESLSVIPTYTNCEFNGIEGIKFGSVKMGGCSLVFHAGGTYDVAGANCASEPITVPVAPTCTVTVGPQSGLPGPVFSELGFGAGRYVHMTSTFEAGLKYTATGKACVSSGTFTDGSYRSDAYLRSATGLWVE
jgi:hypothetical protein